MDFRDFTYVQAIAKYKNISRAVRKEGFRYPWLDLTCLKNEVMFLNDASQWNIGRMARQMMREAHIRPEITEFRSLETCLALASRGLGFTLTFDISIKCFKNYEQKPAYLSAGSRPNLAEFAVACRKNYRLKEAEKELVNMIRQKFGPKFSPDDRESGWRSEAGPPAGGR